jgi:GDPmannose 4,6-dehydratase
MPRALITGITGQDGSYLAERLLAEGWDVHGLRHAATSPALQGQEWVERVSWHEGDLADTAAIAALVDAVEPTEVYNLAGITSVAQSWDAPVLTAQVTAVGSVGLMKAAWDLQQRTGQPVRVLQPSSAEIFGSPTQVPQSEQTPIAPTSPYGAAKAYAHIMAAIFRSRGLGVSTCVLYNHESPRRPPSFVTRKITRTVARIRLGLDSELVLGNLDVRRDWGWAPDYVDAMVRACRHPEADDYVVATGEAHSVEEFVGAAFERAGLTSWRELVRVDQAFVRPMDAHELRGDAKKARTVLGWVPTVGFEELVSRMVAADLAAESAS